MYDEIIENDAVTITGYDSTYGEDVVIPGEIDGYPVVKIGDSGIYRLFWNPCVLTDFVLCTVFIEKNCPQHIKGSI